MAENIHPVRDEIERILTEALQPEHLEVIDDSHRHIGHAGHNRQGESHFKLIIKSQKLNGLSRVKAHQEIYSLLDSLMKRTIHALQIKIQP